MKDGDVKDPGHDTFAFKVHFFATNSNKESSYMVLYALSAQALKKNYIVCKMLNTTTEILYGRLYV